MEIKRYKKKPVVLQAAKFSGSKEDIKQADNWLGR